MGVHPDGQAELVMLGLSDDLIARFRNAIEARMGLRFEDAKRTLLAEVLRRRLAATAQPCESYLRTLEVHADVNELGELARELTVPETYFFRNSDQLEAFVNVALPERLAARGPAGRVSVLSAGCASGEEAYSLAMLLSERGARASLTAFDVNPDVLAKAARGRYSAWALRETPKATRERWFSQQGNDFVLDETVRRAVVFEQRNLAEDDERSWLPARHDVVFCRNVLMYFSPEKARTLVSRLSRILVPGGYLFLGHAETLRGISVEFELCHTHGTFYYRRRAEAQIPVEPSSLRSDASAQLLSQAISGADSWVDSIQRATQRIEALADARPAAGNGSPAVDWNLDAARELFAREQYGDALDLVTALPSRSARDPDVLLLHAVLLVHRGNLALAEEVCARLLELDGMSAGAHYVLALCREAAGDRRAAADHDQYAVYLDPGFAMPRLHLGLLARRAGDAVTARRELAQAVVLLQREDASRVLLFGGGFGRDALLALCRAEIAACGGAT
jgi:chemotaxis protein methyltransferase CheR